jgi:hypothetical protein
LKLTLNILYRNIINIYYISIQHITGWNPSQLYLFQFQTIINSSLIYFISK